tara:strand:+ start:410 stop:685 length:276 start_codon:yes stop_codon:yes gene_type:complete
MTTPKKKNLPKTNIGDIVEGFGFAGGPRGFSKMDGIKEIKVKPKVKVKPKAKKKKKMEEEIEEVHPTKKYYRKQYPNKKQRMELFGNLYED